MVNLLAVLVALAAIGLLFALDPGEAIADSGFPDLLEMEWNQQAAWGFRLVGVGIALLLMLGLWIRYRIPSQGMDQAPVSGYPSTPQPGSMPAAAVSVLEHREATDRTLLASVIEMCQRGTLRIEVGGTRGNFRYRLLQQNPPIFAWERSICDNLPTRATTVRELRDRMNDQSDAVGDRVGEYLKDRGFFHENPVRFKKEHFSDGIVLGTLSGVLMGGGGGLWADLWLSLLWANAIIGAGIGCTYWLIATPVNTGTLSPTLVGAYETGLWLKLKGSLAGPGLSGGGEEADPMLAYAVALDSAQPWLAPEASAPSWWGPDEAASLRRPELDEAYHRFLNESAWGLAGGSENATEAAAEPDYETDAELFEFPAPLGEGEEHSARRETVDEYGYQRNGMEGPVGESRKGGTFRGCLFWLVGLLGIGALVLVVLLSLDVVSPREKPCPLDSPSIPTPAQMVVAGALFHDECVRVSGTLEHKEVNTLLLEIDRDDYLQDVVVRVPSGIFESVSLGKRVTLGGWLKVAEDGTYEVHFVPERDSDRWWWQNLRENLAGLLKWSRTR